MQNGSNAISFEELEGKIGLLTIDVPGKRVNTFARQVVGELRDWIAKLEGRDDLEGLLFRSGKSGQFIAGADLKELGALAYATQEQVAQGAALGHELFDRISRLPFPTVALIDGAAMGGGTEVTLAMDYRIASTNPKTVIGQPEVKVGLIPGWGGTQRLPRIIGVHHAIEMVCSGEPITAERARALGLVFDAVPAERLVEEGRRLVDHARATGEWREIRHRMEQPMGLSEDQMRFAFAVAEGHLQAKTKGHYPAPLIALAAMRDGINLPAADGLLLERKAFEEVVGSPISANLIGVFFDSTRLGRETGVDDPEVKPSGVKRVGVLGDGLGARVVG